MKNKEQIRAIKLAIGCLERERRARFAADHYAYLQGIRTVEINSNGITGVVGGFAEDGEKEYEKYTKAIGQLQDLLEALED